MIQDGHPHLNQVKTIRYFAIDETDRMVEKGHFEELQNLLEMLNQDETAKKQRQTFVFSGKKYLTFHPIFFPLLDNIFFREVKSISRNIHFSFQLH